MPLDPISYSLAKKHSKRHYADGGDPITGWVSPSEIGPYSDLTAEILWRTKNIDGSSRLNHVFRPSDDTYGRLGTSFYRWLELHAMYVRAYYGFSGGGVFSQDLLPSMDSTYNVGNDSNRWRLIRGVTITAGELGFEETRCGVCGKKFEAGDSLVLKVLKVDKETLTVPVHLSCAGGSLNQEYLNDPPKANEVKCGEFKVLNEEVIDGESLLLTVRFWDGRTVNVPIPIDADEDEVKKRVVREYKRLKEIEAERKRVMVEAKAKGRRSWKGYRGKVVE